MNHEIIEMAEQAGVAFASDEYPDIWQTYMHVGKQEIEAFAKLVEAKKRNDTLEEVAQEFDKMKVFGDTAASFAIFVREMKS